MSSQTSSYCNPTYFAFTAIPKWSLVCLSVMVLFPYRYTTRELHQGLREELCEPSANGEIVFQVLPFERRELRPTPDKISKLAKLPTHRKPLEALWSSEGLPLPCPAKVSDIKLRLAEHREGNCRQEAFNEITREQVENHMMDEWFATPEDLVAREMAGLVIEHVVGARTSWNAVEQGVLPLVWKDWPSGGELVMLKDFDGLVSTLKDIRTRELSRIASAADDGQGLSALDIQTDETLAEWDK